jgi:hypothetical protein
MAMRPVFRGQFSPQFLRRIDPQRGGEGIDVLPPELQINLDNLREDIHPLLTEPAMAVSNVEHSGFVNVSPFITAAIATQTQLLLRQPTTRRIHLVIQNNDATFSMLVYFGSAGQGITLNAGQSLFYDVFVPQDDVYIAGLSAAMLGTLAYSNKES